LSNGQHLLTGIRADDSAAAWILGKVLSRSDGDLEDCAARALQHPVP